MEVSGRVEVSEADKGRGIGTPLLAKLVLALFVVCFQPHRHKMQPWFHKRVRVRDTVRAGSG